MFLGLMFNKVQYIMMVLFMIDGKLFNDDFVGFYLSYVTYGSELFNPFLYHCVICRGWVGVVIFLSVCNCWIFG